MNDPRPNSLVRFSDKDLPEEYWGQYPFKYDRLYLYMGEIPNMPGHCVVMDTVTSEVFCGYHPDIFKEEEDDFR